MAIASVQKKSNFGTLTGTTVAATFDNPMTTAGCTVGAVTWQSGTAACTVSDGTNSYTMRPKVNDAGVDQNLALFYFFNLSGTPSTVTATFSVTSIERGIIIQEFSGVATASAFDVGNQQNMSPGSTATDAITSGTAVTTADGDLIFSACGETVFGSQTFVAGTNFTQQDAITGLTFDIATEAWIVQPTQGTTAGLWSDPTRGAIGNYNVCFISLKAAGGGGGATLSAPIIQPLAAGMGLVHGGIIR